MLTNAKHYISVLEIQMSLYHMEGRSFEAVHEERDLSIMITTDLKCSKQCLNIPALCAL